MFYAEARRGERFLHPEWRKYSARILPYQNEKADFTFNENMSISVAIRVNRRFAFFDGRSILLKTLTDSIVRKLVIIK